MGDEGSPDQREFGDALQVYYEKKVNLSNVEPGNKKYVEKNLAKILKKVNEHDDRFDSKVVLDGCVKTNISSGLPREFRYLVSLNLPEDSSFITSITDSFEPRQYEFEDPPEGYNSYGQPLDKDNGKRFSILPPKAKIVITTDGKTVPAPEYAYGYLNFDGGQTPKGWKDMTVGKGDLNPFLVKRVFIKRLKQALVDLEQNDGVIISKDVTDGVIVLTIFNGDIPITVELKIIIGDVKIPFHQFTTWPRPLTMWPHPLKEHWIKQKGMMLVASGTFYWRESYANPMIEAICDVDAAGGQRGKVFQIVRQLNKDIFSNFGGEEKKQIISHDEIKNIWLWECELRPHIHQWSSYNIAARVLDLIARLLGAIREKTLPEYFDTRINMLKGKKEPDLAKVDARIDMFIRHFESELTG